MRHLLLLLLIGLLTSCGNDSLGTIHEEGQLEFTSSFSIQVQEPVSLVTRSSELSEIKSLRLLIFDKDNKFLYSREAVLNGIDTQKQTFTYSVKLISSFEKRSIHFIANYDWRGFDQDYFLEGLEAGYIVGSLVSVDKTFWRMHEFENLNEQSLKDKSISLFNSKARVEVLCDNIKDFEYVGFKVCNTYDRGTVASFDIDDLGHVKFDQSIQDIKPTIAPSAKLVESGDYSKYPADVFERYTAKGQPLYVIVQGYYNRKICYYKLDLKHHNVNTNVTKLYDITRNHKYKIHISKVNAAGYANEGDAIRSPASNNIFASIELEDFGSISNGKDELIVDNLIQTVVTHPYIFNTSILYKPNGTSSSNNWSKVKLYPSWGNNDPYLATMERGNNSVSVKTRAIPDRKLVYTIDVVASSDGNGSGIITRQIKIILEPPYKFNANARLLNRNAELELNLDIPEGLDQSAFPMPLYIKATGLTPKIDGANNMIIDYRNGEYWFKYVLREKPTTKKLSLFYYNNNTANKQFSIVLNCQYFEDQVINLR